MAKRIFMTFEVRSKETALDRFLKAVRAGSVPDRSDLRIVAAQLESVLDGVSFGRAFGLQVGQGRKESPDIAFRNQVASAEVEELRKEGYTLEGAADLVSQRYAVSPESVIKIYKDRAKSKRELSALLRRAAQQGKN